MSLCMPQLPCQELLSSRGISLPVMVMVKTTWYSGQPGLLLPDCLLSCYPTLLQPSAAGQWIVFISPTMVHCATIWSAAVYIWSDTISTLNLARDSSSGSGPGGNHAFSRSNVLIQGRSFLHFLRPFPFWDFLFSYYSHWMMFLLWLVN